MPEKLGTNSFMSRFESIGLNIIQLPSKKKKKMYHSTVPTPNQGIN